MSTEAFMLHLQSQRNPGTSQQASSPWVVSWVCVDSAPSLTHHNFIKETIMAKPSNNPPAGMHLIQLQNISWGSKLLISSSLLSQFAELMAKIEVVEEEYMQGGAYTIAPVGEPDYGISTVTGKHVFCASKKEADAFRSYHNATFEMLHNDDRPSNRPCVSIEEFRSQPKVTE